VKHPTELHVADPALERVDVLRNRGERLVVGLGAGEIEQLRAVLEPRTEVGQRANDRFELLSLFAQLLRALRVVPDAGVFERFGDCGESVGLDVEVKDTSADRQRAAAIRRACWRSG
jgi:hypothetical protein